MSEIREAKQTIPETVIDVQDLWIKYILHLEKRRTLRKWVTRLGRTGGKREFWALRGISFSVQKGELVGVIGKNGSGKSTLLRVLAGILTPDRGSVCVLGRIGTMLKLGAGFKPDLVGRDNILLNGLILGLSKEDIENKETEMISFAELETFIDAPLKTYSSGMKARLSFSVATSIDADVLLVDEILSVGDEAFRNKSYSRMMELYSGDRTVVFVSHSLNQLVQICSRIIWLDEGRILFDGPPEEAVKRYRESLR
jgi:ABC-type polysaccharide/polyol phosphate transport system ATPase subunit